jgi:hypothetical protein
VFDEDGRAGENSTMGFREITGYCAHVLLAAYWLWVLACTAPQLRKGARNKGLRLRILLVKSAGLLLTAALVGVIHYWATAWWQVAVALPIATVLGVLLRRSYRRLVAAPRHLRTLSQRAKTVHIRRPDDTPAAHSHRQLPREPPTVFIPGIRQDTVGWFSAAPRAAGPDRRDAATASVNAPGLRP